MEPHEVLEQALETSQGPALIAFMTAGYPAAGKLSGHSFAGRGRG